MSSDPRIHVNELNVRRALANSFVEGESGEHAWSGSVGIGDRVVSADVRSLSDGRPYVMVSSACVPAPPLDGDLARLLVIESAGATIGRLVHRDGQIVVEHGILAGVTMASVEVQAAVWTVGWTSDALAPRLAALLQRATPVPHVPELPAALRRDSADHVRMTTDRVQRFLTSRYGGFEHDPAWGFHGGFGSARVFVEVLPVLEDSTAVRASSPVLSEVDLSDALALRLHELTAAGAFGGFVYLPTRREVWFEHVVLGDDLDAVELETGIDAVASVADGQDDALAAEFGGRRYADLA